MAKLIDQFGTRLRMLRRQRSLTLEQLGRSAGIGFKHIAEIERGIKSPSFETIGRLAKALSVEAYELFLPDRLDNMEPDRKLRVIVREIARADPQLKRFLSDILSAARDLADGA